MPSRWQLLQCSRAMLEVRMVPRSQSPANLNPEGRQNPEPANEPKKLPNLCAQGAMAAEGTAAAMRGAAAAERLRRALAALSVRYSGALQPTADALGRGLGLPEDPITIFSEEVCTNLFASSPETSKLEYK